MNFYIPKTRLKNIIKISKKSKATIIVDILLCYHKYVNYLSSYKKHYNFNLIYINKKLFITCLS